MSLPPETFDIDAFGDILLVLLQGDPSGNDGDIPLDDYSEPDTQFDDASSLDTLITEGMLAGASEPPLNNAGPPTRRAVRFRVASHSLRRSSWVFQSLLDEYVGYPGAAYQSHYPIRVPIWDDDPSTMALVLRIIHEDILVPNADQDDFRTFFPTADRFTDQINLPTLARIAVIVQKYHLQAAVDHCLTEWIDGLWKHMHGSTTSDAVTWVWVTWVFELTDHFAAATKYLAKNGTHSLEGSQEAEGPCPLLIIRAIDRIRTDALTELCSLFLAQIEPFAQMVNNRLKRAGLQHGSEMGNVATIQEACGIGLLLVMGSRLNFWPQHDADFRGTSYADAAKTTQAMIKPGRYGVGVTPSGLAELKDLSSCGDQFIALLSCLEDREWELKMDEFKFKARQSDPMFTY
ncbi:hypothetical protein NCS52_00585200 [Fusarium sp. LHS14.1]|nr:hypothetical protein NCS52_00585200 [Fusarium sp. LHS14.1]